MFADAHRPRYHFTPPDNWMNDPNGLVYHDGEYHLFYQHNPYGTDWGHMSWGHAVSRNLVDWEHLPIAIWEKPDEGYTIFSGGAVADHDNTMGGSDIGRGSMVAVYTADHRTQDPRVQNIHVATSWDGGRRFEDAGANPVLDVGEAKFGDPKVFWHGTTEKWVMVSISGLGQGHVAFYGSYDLLTWAPLSEFHADDEAPGVWECPDLFPMPLDGDPEQVRWVLKTNCVTFGGGPSGTRFFLGEFDGEAFTDAVPIGRTLTSDDGAIYAEATYNNMPDGRRIALGWLRQQPVDGRQWTGTLSVPRELRLRSDGRRTVLCVEPASELTSRRRERWVVRDRSLGDVLALDEPDLSASALEVRLVLDLRHATGGGVRLQLSAHRTVLVGVDVANRELYVQSGDGPPVATGCAVETGSVVLRVLLDRSVVEAFAGDTSAVTTILPHGVTYERLSVFGTGVAPHLVRADVWTMGDA